MGWPKIPIFGRGCRRTLRAATDGALSSAIRHLKYNPAAMKISREWLGDYVDLTDLTDEQIARRLTEIGHAVEAIEQAAGDTVFEIEFTTNRIDATSHLGLARELSAALGRALLTTSYETDDAPAAPTDDASIRIDAPDMCGRYTGIVIRGVKVGESGARVRRRLEAVGLRPINNVVDATNYVMMAVGHPLHAFDLDRISGRQIIVRAGRPGERIRTLDGETRSIGEDTVVIADASHAVALGGVIGGFDSEITSSTTSVLLECAHFNPAVIRRTARKLGIHTDASYRFERGADPGDTVAAARQCAALIAEQAGGAREQPIDVLGRAPIPVTLVLREQALHQMSAGSVGLGYALDLFRRLGMECRSSAGQLSVTVPSWRSDLTEEMDLIEEVLRFFGFDNVPAALPRVTTGDVRHDELREADERVRDILVGCGLTEVVTYSFIHPEWNRLFATGEEARVTNALTENLAAMRLSVIPGLLDVVAFNRSYGTRDGALFEVGRTYHPENGKVRERSVVTIALFGSVGTHWGEAKRQVDFFDLKGVVETLLQRFHLQAEFLPAALIWARPGEAASARIAGNEIATAGFVRREVLQHFGIKGDVAAAEIDLEQLARSRGKWQMSSVSRYPGVPMVLGVLHRHDLPWDRLVAEIRALEIPHLQEIGIRDRYIAEGSEQVKTTIGMWYQAFDRSLTQEEVAEAHARVAARLAGRLPVEIVGS